MDRQEVADLLLEGRWDALTQDRDRIGERLLRCRVEAVDLLRKAGHDEIAERIDRELVGRNVIEERWTFQIVEDYDDGYYALFKQLEAGAREELVGGRRHLFEAEMKEKRRTHGARHHEAAPDPRL